MRLETVPPEVAATVTHALGIDPSALGLTGFVSLIIVSIIRGWLIPVGTYRSIIAAKDAEIERFKLALVAEQTRGDVQDETVRQMVGTQATTQHLIQELHVSLMRLSDTEIPARYPPPVVRDRDPSGGAP